MSISGGGPRPRRCKEDSNLEVLQVELTTKNIVTCDPQAKLVGLQNIRANKNSSIISEICCIPFTRDIVPRNVHKSKDLGFRIPAHIESKSL